MNDELVAKRIPLFVMRGGRDIKKMPRSHLDGADGVVAHTEACLVSDHPVCGAKVGFAELFLMPQPPLLTRRGICRTKRYPFVPAAQSARLQFRSDLTATADNHCP